MLDETSIDVARCLDETSRDVARCWMRHQEMSLDVWIQTSSEMSIDVWIQTSIEMSLDVWIQTSRDVARCLDPDIKRCL